MPDFDTGVLYLEPKRHSSARLRLAKLGVCVRARAGAAGESNGCRNRRKKDSGFEAPSALLKRHTFTARGKKHPSPRPHPGQVHPIARSLASHRVLPAQLNAGLQLPGNSLWTKTALPGAPGLDFETRESRERPAFLLCHGHGFYSLRKKPAARVSAPPSPYLARSVAGHGFRACGKKHPRRCTPPGSPHSKKPSLTPSVADTSGFRTPTPQYCP